MQIQARCPNGHPIRFWGGPLLVDAGKVPNLWGNPIVCGECGQKLGVQRG